MSIKYPETHPIAVLSRVAFILSLAALLIASLIKPPRLFYSYHAQHFAAFYVLSLATALTVKRKSVISLGLHLALFAVVFELARALAPRHADTNALDWFADAAGIVGALVPMMAQKLRERFEPEQEPGSEPGPVSP
jgi:hypothetical protein